MPVSSDWSQRLRAFVNKWKREPGLEEYLADNPFGEFVQTEQAESWDGFLAWLNEFQRPWCFRGQREASWLLHTSLDRAVRREYSSENCVGIYHLDRETEGRAFFLRFQQQAHDYTRRPPSCHDLNSWFALMQHYGAPTRFLDWTKSPYIAMYFALEEEPKEKVMRSAVWAIDLDWLENKGRELLPSEAGSLSEREKPVIVRVNPLETNERMAAQQGVLLCNLFDEATFNQILMAMMIRPETPNQPVVRKLEVKRNHRVEFLKKLGAMNIHRFSLFPDLDRFGQSTFDPLDQG